MTKKEKLQSEKEKEIRLTHKHTHTDTHTFTQTHNHSLKKTHNNRWIQHLANNALSVGNNEPMYLKAHTHEKLPSSIVLFGHIFRGNRIQYREHRLFIGKMLFREFHFEIHVNQFSLIIFMYEFVYCFFSQNLLKKIVYGCLRWFESAFECKTKWFNDIFWQRVNFVDANARECNWIGNGYWPTSNVDVEETVQQHEWISHELMPNSQTYRLQS